MLVKSCQGGSCRWACDWTIEHKRCSTLRQGRISCPLNLGLVSQIFWHVAAKSRVLWPSKCAKMRFPGLH